MLSYNINKNGVICFHYVQIKTVTSRWDLPVKWCIKNTINKYINVLRRVQKRHLVYFKMCDKSMQINICLVSLKGLQLKSLVISVLIRLAFSASNCQYLGAHLVCYWQYTLPSFFIGHLKFACLAEAVNAPTLHLVSN